VFPSPLPNELLKSQPYLCTKAYSTFDQFTQPRNQLTQDGHIQILQALKKGKGQSRVGGGEEKQKGNGGRLELVYFQPRPASV